MNNIQALKKFPINSYVGVFDNNGCFMYYGVIKEIGENWLDEIMFYVDFNKSTYVYHPSRLKTLDEME